MTTAKDLINFLIMQYIEGQTESGIEVTVENATELLDEYNSVDGELTHEATNEVRCSFDEETDIERPRSRHYECKSVAKKICDQWVGWPYWYGGGKHGEPESIEWVDDAYLLDVTETQQMVTVREFFVAECDAAKDEQS